MLSLRALVLPVVALSAVTFGQSTNGVSKQLLGRLQRGVNVTRWFCYWDANDDAHFRNYLNDQDFAAFKRLGVGFVRLCISPDVIYRDGAPDLKRLEEVDQAISRFSRAGIAVLWDLHDNGQLKLDSPGKDNSGFVRFWETIASHYKARNENDVVFELVNEPVFRSNASIWFDLQNKTVEAIGAIDPHRTIMVSGTSWSGIDDLSSLPPLPRRNLIYTFHCYDPFLFTHQGASWVGPPMVNEKSFPFPSSPEAAQAVMASNPESLHGALSGYGNDRFDSNYLFGRISKAALWAKTHHVPIVLGEFGSYPLVAPPDSRARWFAGMRKAIDRLKMPNAVWGYDDAMGLGRKLVNGKLWLDPVTLKNLYGR